MSDAPEIFWEDPPKSHIHESGIYDSWINALRNNPGRWAMLRGTNKKNSRSKTQYLKRTFSGCEFCSRNGKVYGRAMPQAGDEK